MVSCSGHVRQEKKNLIEMRRVVLGVAYDCDLVAGENRKGQKKGKLEVVGWEIMKVIKLYISVTGMGTIIFVDGHR